MLILVLVLKDQIQILILVLVLPNLVLVLVLVLVGLVLVLVLVLVLACPVLINITDYLTYVMKCHRNIGVRSSAPFHHNRHRYRTHASSFLNI